MEKKGEGAAIADSRSRATWVTAQPWCNGVVSTTRLSYGGGIQWAAPSQRLSHLKAMISVSAFPTQLVRLVKG